MTTALRRWPWLALLSAGAASALLYLARERRRSDEVAVLRTIGRLDESCLLSRRRIQRALMRVWRRGDAVRGPGCSWLTRTGWARVGRPLSGDEMLVLRKEGRVAGVEALLAALDSLRRRGLVDNDGDIVDAGRAVLEAM